MRVCWAGPVNGLIAGQYAVRRTRYAGAAWVNCLSNVMVLPVPPEVAMACAMLVCELGGLIGGPVARYLVKHSHHAGWDADDQAVPTAFEKRMWVI